MSKELIAVWKERKKKGGLKLKWKRKKVEPLLFTETPNALGAVSDHTTERNTDGGVRHAV